METTSQKIINEINVNIPILNDKITKGIEEYKNYLEVLKYEEFKENVNETEEESIKKAESILDRLYEMIKRNDSSNMKLKEIVEDFNKIINNIEDEKEKLAERNNEIIDIVIDLEKRKVDKLILQNPRKRGALKGEFEDKKEECNEHRINTEKIIRKKQQEEVLKKTNNTNNINQIEEWTQMKIGNVIFDSNIDNWNQNTSVFDQKIFNKNNLLFLIEEKNGNLFGGYVNAKIDKYDELLNDPKSFVFSLKPNEMLKYHIKSPQKVFKLYKPSSESLFAIEGSGFSLYLFKEEKKYESSICKKLTETKTGNNLSDIRITIYNEKTYLAIRRLWVIQLI